MAKTEFQPSEFLNGLRKQPSAPTNELLSILKTILNLKSDGGVIKESLPDKEAGSWFITVFNPTTKHKTTLHCDDEEAATIFGILK